MPEPETRQASAALPEARQRRTRWPGWVWLIPLVALGFAGWLMVEQWVIGPRPLTVHFSSVEGVKPGAAVRYKGVQVGSVSSIRLDDDLGGATLVLDMTALKGRLGDQTRIWIERPSFSPESIGSLISGPWLAILPGGEGEVEELQALEEAPVLAPEAPGRVFVLEAKDVKGLSADAPVMFRGIQVGHVLGRRFGEDGRVEIPIFVEKSHAGLVREATVFWRAGGFNVETAGGLSVDLPSLATIATGVVAFETPEVLAGAEAEAEGRFALWESHSDAVSAPKGPKLEYQIIPDQPAGDLARGAPVTLVGRQVGYVMDTGLEVAPGGRGLITPVTIVIDARRMGIEDLAKLASREALREELNGIITRLVEAGMRARIKEGGVVFGARSIELVMEPNAAPAEFSTEEPVPVIPAGGKSGIKARSVPDEGATAGHDSEARQGAAAGQEQTTGAEGNQKSESAEPGE